MWLVCLLAAMLAGCTYVNVPKNKLSKSVTTWRRNANDRAEMFTEQSLLSARRDLDGDENSAPTIATTRPIALRDTERDGYFVGVAISGGGSRSAVFSAACLFQLQRIGLLQRVDCISSVSGGSLTAAYYCLSDDKQWNPQDLQQKLTHPFATDLFWSVLAPWNAVALMVSDYDRSDILAADFQQVLFSRDGRGLTFHDLRVDRPRLLINATDLQSGNPFVFSNRQFDEINSDIDSYPIAYAVAASSAVPAVLHPVTLRDFSTTFAQYRHLIDGGVSDNSGVQSLVQSYEAQIARPDNPYTKGAIFIIIDAGTQFDERLSDVGDTGLFESLRAGLGLSSTLLLNRASTATLGDIIVEHVLGTTPASELRHDIDTLRKEHFIEMRDTKGHAVWIAHLSLGQVGELGRLPYQSFGESLNGISTYFNITPTDAYNLFKAADLLFHQRFDARLEPLVRQIEEQQTLGRSD